MTDSNDKIVFLSSGEIVGFISDSSKSICLICLDVNSHQLLNIDPEGVSWLPAEQQGYKIGDMAVVSKNEGELKVGDLVYVLALADDFTTVTVKTLDGGILFIPISKITPYRELGEDISKLLED